MSKGALGIGNALVDILVHVDDSFLDKYRLEKGSMQLVTYEIIQELLLNINTSKLSYASGGSAANTIHGITELGISTGYIGKIGNDSFGLYFENDFKQDGIEPFLLKSSSSKTGNALTLITPDSERTFATFLGAAVELEAADIKEEYFKGFKLLHLEGYLVTNHLLVEKVVSLARQHNLIISLDLASYNIVVANYDFLKKFISQYIDIVFANEIEAKAITGKENPIEALEDISKISKIAVVKVGAGGSYIRKGNEQFNVDAFSVKAIDTTGAGDLYAAGFLYGFLNDLPLDKCGKLGSFVASEVVQQIGARIHKKEWIKIKNLLPSILK